MHCFVCFEPLGEFQQKIRIDVPIGHTQEEGKLKDSEWFLENRGQQPKPEFYEKERYFPLHLCMACDITAKEGTEALLSKIFINHYTLEAHENPNTGKYIKELSRAYLIATGRGGIVERLDKLEEEIARPIMPTQTEIYAEPV